jgi:hypothetical protein
VVNVAEDALLYTSNPTATYPVDIDEGVTLISTPAFSGLFSNKQEIKGRVINAQENATKKIGRMALIGMALNR